MSKASTASSRNIILTNWVKFAKSSPESAKFSPLLTNFISEVAGLAYKVSYTFQDLVTKPRYFAVFILARFYWLRKIYVGLHELLVKTDFSTLENLHQANSSLFPDLDPESSFQTLKKDGVCSGLKLPSVYLQELLQYLEHQDCYAGGQPHLGFKLSAKEELDKLFPQPFYVARYFNLSNHCPQIMQLANDPKIRQIATR